MGVEAVRIYALYTLRHGIVWVRSGPYGPAHAPFYVCQRRDGRRVLWGREDAGADTPCPCLNCRGGETESREARVRRLLASLEAAPRELRGLRSWLAKRIAEAQGG